MREEVRLQRPDLLSFFDRLVANRESKIPERAALSETETVRMGDSSFQPGSLISDRYEVIAKVGEGGMGCVYQVSDRFLPERGSIALKTIKPELVRNPDMMLRFEREVRLSLNVEHPNVCRTYDIGRHGAGENLIVYLTMRFIPGGRLADWLKDGRTRRVVPQAEALPLFAQMAAGLAAIHEQKIVHRDFKPGNVMLARTETGLRPVITARGLARTVEDPVVTMPGAVMGTPGYIAPEGTGTFAADVYALGITVLEMLTGTRSAPEGVEQALLERGVEPWLRNVVAKCCETDPLRRYLDAGDVVRALEEGQAERTSPLPPKPADQVEPVWHKWLKAGAIAGCAMLALFAVVQWLKPKVPARALELTANAAEKMSNLSFLDASRVLEEAVSIAPRYAMAHAMLADADNELELTGRANREMNRIEAGDLRQAASDERLYIEGVRLTLTREYSAATDKFRRYYEVADEAAKPARSILLGRAMEKAQKPTEAARAYEAAGKRGGALLSLAVLDSRQQRIPKALQEFEEARKELEALGEHGAIGGLLYQIGAAYNRWVRLPEAEVALRSCVEQTKVVGDEYDSLRCRHQLAVIALQMAKTDKNFMAARRDLTKIIGEAGRAGFQVLQARAWLSLGQTDGQRGDFANAGTDYSEALARAESEGAVRVRALVNLVLAELLRKTGRTANAEKAARAALAFFEPESSRKEAGQAAVALSRALRDEGDLDKAEQVLDERKSLFASLSGSDVAQMHEALANVESDRDDYPAAIREMESAIAAAPNGSNAPLYRVRIAEYRIDMGLIGEGRAALAAVRSAAPASMMLEESIRETEALADLFELRDDAVLRDLEWNGKVLDPILAGLAMIRSDRAEAGIASCEGARSQSDSVGRQKNIDLCVAEGYLVLNRPGEALLRLKTVEESGSKSAEFGWRASALRIRIEEAGSSRELNSAPGTQMRVSLAALKGMWGAAAVTNWLRRPDVRRDLKLTKVDIKIDQL